MKSKGLILVVDDVEDTRQLLGELLRLSGYDAIEASSGEEALARALQQPPDLVVTDFMMPGMNGVELASSLRKHPELERLPVFLITAVGAEGVARATGMMAHPALSQVIAKPFDPDALLRLINSTLAG